MNFWVYPWRFGFRAVDSLFFPEGKSGNILRGAFGIEFRRLICRPDCSSVNTCEWRHQCAYARFFEPSSLGAGPSGLADQPRPFVFRAAHLDNRTIRTGESFHFDLHVFTAADPGLSYLTSAFAQLAQEGIGPGRGRAELVSVWQLDDERSAGVRVYHEGAFELENPPGPLSVSLVADEEAASRVVVRFETATELKAEQGIVSRPEFSVLFARARDRVATLGKLYGDGSPDVDFHSLGELSRRVKMERCEVRQIHAERRSSRTGQTHPLGGFVGEVEYVGELAPFLPFLRAAEWTGVGRQTVWGKGAIRLLRPVLDC